jgi:hypothetical protein
VAHAIVVEKPDTSQRKSLSVREIVQYLPNDVEFAVKVGALSTHLH